MAKHGLDFADLTLAFFEFATITPARHGRFRAIGTLGTGTVVAIFAPLGTEAIAVVSLRPASNTERKVHEQGI